MVVVMVVGVVVVVNKKFLVELCKANFVGTSCVSSAFFDFDE